MANLSYCRELNFVRLDLQGCGGHACANAVHRVLTECSGRGVRFAEVFFSKDYSVLQPLVESALLQEPLRSCIEHVQPTVLTRGRVSKGPSPQDATGLLLRFRRTEAPIGDYLRGFRYGRGKRVNAVKLNQSSLEPEIESSLLTDLMAHL